MYPTNVPLWEIPIQALYSGYLWVNYLQESLENTINTMGTLLGVHPIVPWYNNLRIAGSGAWAFFSHSGFQKKSHQAETNGAGKAKGAKGQSKAPVAGEDTKMVRKEAEFMGIPKGPGAHPPNATFTSKK